MYIHRASKSQISSAGLICTRMVQFLWYSGCRVTILKLVAKDKSFQLVSSHNRTADTILLSCIGLTSCVVIVDFKAPVCEDFCHTGKLFENVFFFVKMKNYPPVPCWSPVGSPECMKFVMSELPEQRFSMLRSIWDVSWLIEWLYPMLLFLVLKPAFFFLSFLPPFFSGLFSISCLFLSHFVSVFVFLSCPWFLKLLLCF